MKTMFATILLVACLPANASDSSIPLDLSLAAPASNTDGWRLSNLGKEDLRSFMGAVGSIMPTDVGEGITALSDCAIDENCSTLDAMRNDVNHATTNARPSITDWLEGALDLDIR